MKLLLNVKPNPVDINQTVYINAFFTHTMPTSTGQYGDRHENITIDIVNSYGVTINVISHCQTSFYRVNV